MCLEAKPSAGLGRFTRCLEHLGYEVSWADDARIVLQGHHDFQIPVHFLAGESHLVVRGRKVIGEYSSGLYAKLLRFANRLNQSCSLLRISLSPSVQDKKLLALEADANLPIEVTQREFNQIFSLWSQEISWFSREFLDTPQS